jgi:hypothetical protein
MCQPTLELLRCLTCIHATQHRFSVVITFLFLRYYLFTRFNKSHGLAVPCNVQRPSTKDIDSFSGRALKSKRTLSTLSTVIITTRPTVWHATIFTVAIAVCSAVCQTKIGYVRQNVRQARYLMSETRIKNGTYHPPQSLLLQMQLTVH